MISSGVKTYGIVRSDSRRATESSDFEVAKLGLAGAKLFSCHDWSCDALESILATAQPTTVIHLAAGGVSSGGRDVTALLKANVDLTVNLFRAADRACRPIILHAGSCFEYADFGEQDVDESSPVHPFSLYGATKSASVQLAIGLAHELDLRHVVLRLFGLYGPSESPRRLVPTLIRNLSQGRATPLSPGTQVRDLMFVEDVASAYMAALQNLDSLENNGVYNICTGQGHSIRQVGESIADEMNQPRSLLRWDTLPARSGEPERIVGNGSRFQQATGWQPQHDLRSGIRQTIRALVPTASPLRRAA